MKPGWKKVLLFAGLIIGGGSALLGLFQLIQEGYSLDWTGFGEYTPLSPDAERGKTLWDWMELLIIPIVLAIGAFLLNRSERKTEREIAKDRQQEMALQTYIDKMSELLLEKNLRTTKTREVRNVARTVTLSVMRVLNRERNNLVIQFLREAALITDGNSILTGADMAGMDLQGLNLRFVFLQEVNLQAANLQGAHLGQANLQKADIRGANLTRTKLPLADLSGALLWRAKLREANLPGANLSGTEFLEADLRKADLSEADLQKANLKGANLDGANLYNANLQEANITREQLAAAKSFYGPAVALLDGSKRY